MARNTKNKVLAIELICMVSTCLNALKKASIDTHYNPSQHEGKRQYWQQEC